MKTIIEEMWLKHSLMLLKCIQRRSGEYRIAEQNFYVCHNFMKKNANQSATCGRSIHHCGRIFTRDEL